MTTALNEQIQDPPARRAGWSHDWQNRWSHETGRKALSAVPCSWQATPCPLLRRSYSVCTLTARQPASSLSVSTGSIVSAAQGEVSMLLRCSMPPEACREASSRLWRGTSRDGKVSNKMATGHVTLLC